MERSCALENKQHSLRPSSSAAKLPYQILHVSLGSCGTRARVERHVTNHAVLDDYGDLEPSISGKIMELHHSKHHQTYVNSYNDATEKMAAAEASDDPAAKIALQPLINFHGGGHINHSLFWENLAPKNAGGGEPPSGPLAKAIEQYYGGLDGMKTKFNVALAGIQGSGWAWLVQDTQTGAISIKTYAVSTPRLDANHHMEACTACQDLSAKPHILSGSFLNAYVCRTKTLLSDNSNPFWELMLGSML